jgi:lysophospholipase L1-like esterase
MRNLAIFFLLFIFACSNTRNTTESNLKNISNAKTYLALGDSYTIGEMVDEKMRWPNLLVNQFKAEGLNFEKPIIVAKTGWRADELADAVKNIETKSKFDLVSIQIGVNNQYQGIEILQFQEDLRRIIGQATVLSKHGVESVFALSIPDYSVTPFARKKNPEKIAAEIKEYNALYQATCKEYGIKFYDITPVSQEAARNTQLIADDKLHPSGKMYQFWVNKISSSIITEIIK